MIFDDDRKNNDQLIAQYSLIPTPLSFFGEIFVAGKTENCMSHPDIRGSGIYFPHEKKYFEVAKKRFKVFFTTTGEVAKGAPGRIREKLGYRAFDDWVSYSIWICKDNLQKDLMKKLPLFLRKIQILGRTVTYFATIIIWNLFKPEKFKCFNQFQSFTDENVPFKHIENLWERNKNQYGITVERSTSYLQWRLRENPYQMHNYLCYYEKDVLMGYVVLAKELNTFFIVDIFVNKKDSKIFQMALKASCEFALQNGVFQIKCNTMKRSSVLSQELKSAGFFSLSEFFNLGFKKKSKKPSQLFVYISDEIISSQNVWDPENWYVTDLIKEGRPYN